MPDIQLSKTTQTREGDGFVRVAYRGTWMHPVTRKPFELTDAKFEAWKKYFDYLSSHGEKIPLVKLHSFDPTERLGSVEDVRIDDAGFWIKPSYASPAIEEAIKLAGFSVYSSEETTQFDGQSFEYALIHVGITDYPVLKNLKQTLAASVFEQKEVENEGQLIPDITITTKPTDPEPKPPKLEKPVALSKVLASALNLSEDSADEVAVKAIEKLIAQSSGLSAQQNKLVTLLVAKRTSQIEALSLEPEDKKKLQKFCTPEIVLSDANSDEESMFDLTLSLLAKAKPEEEESYGDEEFLSGHQNKLPKKDGTGEALSLVSVMKDRNKQFYGN